MAAPPLLDTLYADVASLSLTTPVRVFGSARVIGENLALTARHVIRKAGDTGMGVKVWRIQCHGGAEYEGTVCWQGGDGLDIALLTLHPLGGQSAAKPRLELRIGAVAVDTERKGRLLGFPRGARVEDAPQLLNPSGAIERAAQLTFAVDSAYRPKNPETDWPGSSGGAVSLTHSPELDKIWIYGVVQTLGPHFDNLIRIAPLATAWEDRAFRTLIRERVPGIEAPSDPLAPKEEGPYRGLESFREEDGTLFFGRDKEIELLRRKVSESSFVVIYGKSGCGKSSLVHGGLIPALQKASAKGHRVPAWKVVALNPGWQPVYNLAKEIGLDAAALLQGDANDGSRRLRRMCNDLLDEHGHQYLLLYIEQWEELYTRRNDQETIERFVSLVTGVGDDRIKVVVSVRDRFYPALSEHRQMPDRLPDQQVNIRQIDKIHLREVIECPAARCGLTFDPPYLVTRILEDADVETLPMLQYALKETWKQRVGNTLTEDGYQFVGGVSAAIRTAGDNVYGGLGANDQAAARRLFLRMIQAEDGLSIPAPIPKGAEYHAAIKDFENARLIIVDDETRTVQAAHGSIIAHWPALKNWWTDNQERMRARRIVLEAKRQNRHLNGSMEIAHGKLLIDTPGDVEVDDITEYIKASIAEDDRQRDQQRRDEEQRRNVKILGHLREIAAANARLLDIDTVVRGFLREIRDVEGYDFVMVQLIDQAERAIETIDGIGLEGDWNPIGKHSLVGTAELLDIQAAIATARPPAMEVLAGWDDRFDEYIWTSFEHVKQRRIFAPILLGSGGNCTWHIDEAARPFNRRKQTVQDSRCVYHLNSADTHWKPPVILGTVEAGFYNHRLPISPSKARNLAQRAEAWARDLHAASLGGVLEHIAQVAMDMWAADVVAIQFHEAADGYRYQYVLGPQDRIRAGLAGDVARTARASGNNRFAPEEPASENGLRLTPGFGAEAALPFVLTLADKAPQRGGDKRASRRGMLYLAFQRDRSFSREEQAFLEQLVSEVIGAIRVATHLSQASARSRRLTSLHNIAVALARRPSIEMVGLLNRIAGYARILFGADVVTIYEYLGNKEFRDPPGKDGHLLVPDATLNGRLDEDSAAVRLIHGENVFESPARNNATLFSSRRAPALGANFIERENIRSAAGVILEVFGDKVGVMFLNFRTVHEFSSTEKDSIGRFAQIAATAIRTARHVQQSSPLGAAGP